MSNLDEILIENPVIASLQSDEDLTYAIKSNVKIVFVMYGNILNISEISRRLKEAGKIYFIHADLLDGLKEDACGIEYIKINADPMGIISTKTSVIKHSKQLGMKTILRAFIIDSLSLGTGIKNINDSKPDAVEVLPGFICKKIPDFEGKINVPVIAGGLITDKNDIMESLSSGAIAISTTERELWNL